MQRQAMAAAYNVKKRSKKMAKGGEVDDYSDVPLKEAYLDENGEPIREPNERDKMGSERAMPQMQDMESMPTEEGNDSSGDEMMMAKGGECMDDAKDADMIARIMHKRKMYSKGGQVANDVGVAEADKLPAEYDDLVLRDNDLEGADYTGENSGDELGNAQKEEDEHDLIRRIMRSRAKKDHNPRPA